MTTDTPNKIIEGKTAQQIAQDFINEYNALCEKYQIRIIVTPAWVARDDGSWSMVLNTGVGRLHDGLK